MHFPEYAITNPARLHNFLLRKTILPFGMASQANINRIPSHVVKQISGCFLCCISAFLKRKIPTLPHKSYPAFAGLKLKPAACIVKFQLTVDFHVNESAIVQTIIIKEPFCTINFSASKSDSVEVHRLKNQYLFYSLS